jgi:hypothetical protein
VLYVVELTTFRVFRVVRWALHATLTTVERFPIGEKRRSKMLWTIAVILIVLWALGLVTSYTLGGFVHILLVIAVVVILIQVIQGRRL